MGTRIVRPIIVDPPYQALPRAGFDRVIYFTQSTGGGLELDQRPDRVIDPYVLRRDYTPSRRHTAYRRVTEYRSTNPDFPECLDIYSQPPPDPYFPTYQVSFRPSDRRLLEVRHIEAGIHAVSDALRVNLQLSSVEVTIDFPYSEDLSRKMISEVMLPWARVIRRRRDNDWTMIGGKRSTKRFRYYEKTNTLYWLVRLECVFRRPWLTRWGATKIGGFRRILLSDLFPARFVSLDLERFSQGNPKRLGVNRLLLPDLLRFWGPTLALDGLDKWTRRFVRKCLRETPSQQAVIELLRDFDRRNRGLQEGAVLPSAPKKPSKRSQSSRTAELVAKAFAQPTD